MSVWSWLVMVLGVLITTIKQGKLRDKKLAKQYSNYPASTRSKLRTTNVVLFFLAMPWAFISFLGGLVDRGLSSTAMFYWLLNFKVLGCYFIFAVVCGIASYFLDNRGQFSMATGLLILPILLALFSVYCVINFFIY